MPTPDVWITPISPAGAAVGFGLRGTAKLSQYTQGGYTWTAVSRPRRKPFLEFTSDALLQLQLPLLLDAADAEGSIEQRAATVAQWTRPTSSTGEPPVLQVMGPIDQQGVHGWVVQTLEWGDQQLRRRDGDRMQADLSLTLLEHNGATTAGSPALASQLSTVVAVLTQSGVQVPSQLSNLIQQLPSLLSSGDSAGLVAQVTAEIAAFISGLPSNATGAAQVVDVALPELLQVLGSLGGTRTYVVREGDTMARIAARELGDYRKAEVIAMLNGIRDWAAIRPNQTLRLP